MKLQDLQVGAKYRVTGMSGNRVDITTHHFNIGEVVVYLGPCSLGVDGEFRSRGRGLWQLVNPCDVEPV